MLEAKRPLDRQTDSSLQKNLILMREYIYFSFCFSPRQLACAKKSQHKQNAIGQSVELEGGGKWFGDSKWCRPFSWQAFLSCLPPSRFIPRQVQHDLLPLCRYIAHHPYVDMISVEDTSSEDVCMCV